MNQIKQDLAFWEAWIEFDPLQSNHFGTLYVLGEVVVKKNAARPKLCKSGYLTSKSRQLVLEINSWTSSSNGRTREIIYSEPITDITQYTSVAVLANGELIAQLGHIEIVV